MHAGGNSQAGTLEIAANAAEIGDNKAQLDAQINGASGQIALDVRYLSEAVQAIKTPQVALETVSPGSPGVFRPVGQESYLHVVMPMTVR